MKTNYDYVQEYKDAYQSMRKRAIEVIKDYGKVLEVSELLKARILNAHGYDKMPDVGTEDYDALNEEYDELKWQEIYSCVFESKHEQVYIANIMMVRYNDETKDVDVYLESDDGYVAEWLPMSWIGYEQDAVYMTILEYIDK